MEDAIKLIQKKRLVQAFKGYTPFHDDKLINGELIDYALQHLAEHKDNLQEINSTSDTLKSLHIYEVMSTLAHAAACIVAEMGRLERLDERISNKT